MPLLNVVVSTSFRWVVSIPSRRRRPPPTTTGKSQRWSSSTRVVRYQRAVELAGAELQDVLAGPLFQLGYLVGDVSLEKRCVPVGLSGWLRRHTWGGC